MYMMSYDLHEIEDVQNNESATKQKLIEISRS